MRNRNQDDGRKRRHAVLWSAVTLGLVAALAAALFARGERPSPELVELASAVRVSVEDGVAPETSRSAEPGVLDSEPEGVRFAREFWGSRWSEVEADLRARGKLRDWDEAPGVPWERAAEEFGERLFPLQDEARAEFVAGNLLQWRGTVDARWLREVLGINSAVSPDQVARIQDIGERHATTIEPLAREWVDRLDFEIRGAWRAGR